MMEDYIIKKNRIKPEALDYQRLRQYGLDYIANLGNKLWSDYNIHDPGITVLELLCYALTDLGYRTSFDIKDILTPSGGIRPDMQDAFIPAHEIFSCQPLTENDYRKWILEHIPCVRNVWIDTNVNKKIIVPKECFRNDSYIIQSANKDEEVKIKGFYRITVDMDLDKLKEYRTTFGRKMNGRFVSQKEYEEEDNYKKYCKHYIRNMFLKIRNLCEDVGDVAILESVYVGICADIEIKPDIKYEPVIEEIGKRINKYINPAIPYYTLDQMLEKGKTVEEIYQGFVPKLGFIDRDELDRFENMKQLNVSDAINLIMGIDGVINVRHFHFVVEDSDIDKNIVSINKFDSVILNEDDYSFRFSGDNLGKPEKESLNEIIITRGLLSFKSPAGIEVKPEADRYIKNLDIELPLPQGNNRELDQYFSIQNEFPKTYKIGQEGISENETNLRKAQRLQFKAYLLFFDQLLADYLSQLDAIKDILSWKGEGWEEKDKTYLFKRLNDEEIADFSKVFSSSDYKKYEKIIEPDNLRVDRRNRFLNHLIARFNEEFVDYSILKFLNKEEDARKDFDEEELIVDKKAFLSNYANVSCGRSRAFDYTEPLDGGTGFFVRGKNICGLEAVLYNKLGIALTSINKSLVPKILSKKGGKIVFEDNRNGNYNDNFGLHVYEHLLMRPFNSLNGKVDPYAFLKLTEDVNQNQIIKDPYTMQITIVVPGWLRISGNIEFRKFVEKIIQMEVPAHIAAKVCWLNPYQMYLLETYYGKYISVLAKQDYPKDDADWEKNRTEALKELVGIFSKLRSIYPPTQLYSDVYSTSDYSAILDYSMLGGDDNEGLWEYKSI